MNHEYCLSDLLQKLRNNRTPISHPWPCCTVLANCWKLFKATSNWRRDLNLWAMNLGGSSVGRQFGNVNVDVLKNLPSQDVPKKKTKKIPRKPIQPPTSSRRAVLSEMMASFNCMMLWEWSRPSTCRWPKSDDVHPVKTNEHLVSLSPLFRLETFVVCIGSSEKPSKPLWHSIILILS